VAIFTSVRKSASADDAPARDEAFVCAMRGKMATSRGRGEPTSNTLREDFLRSEHYCVASLVNMTLHEFLGANRDDVMQRWKANVRGTIAPEAIGPIELIDHLPTFVSEIHAALREAEGLRSTGPSPEDSTTAAGHGEQRLRLGFSLDAVVREYGALRDAIVSTARDAGVQITFRELDVLSSAIISGIAQAVTEYTRQRDAELLRAANEHFAFVAHELRNPLSSAMLAFQLLKNKGLIPQEERSAGALERGLKNASELVDHTLKLARVASGIELRPQATTLAQLFEDAEHSASTEADAKNVVLRLKVNEALPERVVVDRRLISSALSNLLRNAVKYSHEGGTVEVRGAITNGSVTIEVEDACGGLPPGEVEQAFAPFVRLDDRQSGFGLGLAIAKQAIDAHGGRIRVQNLPEKGCIFILEFPAIAAGLQA
jgi:signal transduction histidine kinase